MTSQLYVYVYSQAKNILENGEELTEEVMAEIIVQKIQSAAVINYGES